MPLPLLWLGAGLVGAGLAKSAYDATRREESLRRLNPTPELLNKHKTAVAKHPSDWLTGERIAKPQPGSLVSCGIYNSIDHSGIWTADNLVIELSGNGLVRAVSPKRFLLDRSGKQVFVACDSSGSPLADETAEIRAKEQIFSYRDYHVLTNNCHKFSWYSLSGIDESVTTFSELNTKLAERHQKRIYWDVIDAVI